MGRKRKDAVKVSLRLSVDPALLKVLNELGVNKSKMFEDAAKEFLQQKSIEIDNNLEK